MLINCVGENKDDITEAVHGLDIFTKNYCMNCRETEEKNDLTFNCDNCDFQVNDSIHEGICLVKKFVNNHKHNYPMDIFGSMGSL